MTCLKLNAHIIAAVKNTDRLANFFKVIVMTTLFKSYCRSYWWQISRAHTGSVQIQSKLFITSLVITEYSLSDINLLGTDLFPLKFPLYNRIFT